MFKKTTTLTIDDEVIKEAKEKFLNLSEIAERAIKEKLGKVEIEINNEQHVCDFCGKEEKKSNRDSLNGLSWLWPHERWICSKCLTNMALITK